MATKIIILDVTSSTLENFDLSFFKEKKEKSYGKNMNPEKSNPNPQISALQAQISHHSTPN